jgi:hypothetical protein
MTARQPISKSTLINSESLSRQAGSRMARSIWVETDSFS